MSRNSKRFMVVNFKGEGDGVNNNILKLVLFIYPSFSLTLDAHA